MWGQYLITQFGACLPFQLKLWIFRTHAWMQLPKWECTLKSLGLISCTLPHLWQCVSLPNTLSWLHVPLHSTLSRQPNVKVATFLFCSMSGLNHVWSICMGSSFDVNVVDGDGITNAKFLRIIDNSQHFSCWCSKNLLLQRTTSTIV
jgi:hypothetical protein